MTPENNKRLLWAGAALGMADPALLVSGQRILIGESKVGRREWLEEWRHNDSAPFVRYDLSCSYFTGRSVQTSIFAYSENNMMGRD